MFVCKSDVFLSYNAIKRATTSVKANLLFVLRKPEVGNSNKLQQNNSLYKIYVYLMTDRHTDSQIDRQSDRLTDMANSTLLLLLFKTNIPSLYNYKTS